MYMHDRVPCPHDKHINTDAKLVFLLTFDGNLRREIVFSTIKMASMNYCFTVCRAAEEKVRQENRSDAVDIPKSSSPGAGAYFFGRFFSFGLTPPVSTSTISNPFIVKASHFNDIDDDMF